jgi:hypothetical protein
MTTCKDCGVIIKHCGQNVWIDNTQSEICRVTDKPHRPAPLNKAGLNQARTKEAILAQEGAG